MAACKKEAKVAAPIMDPGKLMHIRMELTPVLVSGVEADTPNKQKRRENKSISTAIRWMVAVFPGMVGNVLESMTWH